MSSLVIIGAQWGDEGKGKLVDYLTSQADLVVRFQGGNNAGHTLVVDGVKTKLNLIPSGILRPHSQCLIGAGVVVDGVSLLHEIETLEARDISITPERFVIDGRVELVLEYHRVIDRAREERRGENRIGTTGRGIGPTYEDRAARTGIRLCELRDLEKLRKKVEDILQQKNRYLQYVLESPLQVSFDEVWNPLQVLADKLLRFEGDVSQILSDAFRSEKRVVFEGAQGTLLDNTFGSAPYVTSSSTISGSVLTGCGVGPKHVGHVLGVAKAYATRVGAGPFPTELFDETGDFIREKGAEFGTVTGRPRRCGWFDACAMRYSVTLSGVDSLAMTKLDVLAGLPKIRLCYAYEINGKKLDYFPSSADELSRVTPLYVDFEGWEDDIASADKWYKLPAQARLYLQTVSEIVGCPISLVSVGAERGSTIFSSQGRFLQVFTESKK